MAEFINFIEVNACTMYDWCTRIKQQYHHITLIVFILHFIAGKIHNPFHFVRDFYFFKRSQYPQLTLLHKNPPDARAELQSQASKLKFVEIGKVMLVWGILKNVTQVVQRVVFLHEDLVKLPSFPRKALETELDLFDEGKMGKVNYELQQI